VCRSSFVEAGLARGMIEQHAHCLSQHMRTPATPLGVAAMLNGLLIHPPPLSDRRCSEGQGGIIGLHGATPVHLHSVLRARSGALPPTCNRRRWHGVAVRSVSLPLTPPATHTV
jgi:hypothetical protein